MIAFIDAHRDNVSEGLPWGVEPICRVLQVAPSTVYAARGRPPSARALRDERLKVEITRVYEANLSVYGADKVWDQLNKDGITVARLHRRASDARHGSAGLPPGPDLDPHHPGRRPVGPARRPGRSEFGRRHPTCCGWRT